ncbi:MAG: UbiD family decarboxylase [Haloarculaceae archaeon]
MRDLREFIDAIDERGQCERVSGADLDREVGGISTLVRREELDAAVLFEEFEDCMPGARLLTNALDTPLQVTLALGQEPTTDMREAVVAQKERASVNETRPVETVDSGPVMANVDRGDEVDLTRFPAPKWHEHDGGRFIGTGDLVVTRHAETGDLNAGTYRVQVHGPRTATISIDSGRDGGRNQRSYFEDGEPFPAAVSVGHSPDLFMAANERLPSGVDELEYVSAQRPEPLEVVEGEATDLPFPARSELVLEGHVYPDRETVTEGPFAEWTGYYGKDAQELHPFVVERAYYRDDPIVLGFNNVPMAAAAMSNTRASAQLWAQLEQVGVTGIDEVNTFLPGVWFQVISMEQQYAGHSTQVGMQAISLPAGVWEGRFTVVVDEDVDAYDLREVVWAMVSRCDPEEDVQVVPDCVSSRLNPRLPPEQKAEGDLTTSRAVIDATRPYHWRDRFPPDTTIDPEFEAELVEQYADLFAAGR